MELTIHTYGHIDAMYYVLNGIAMIMNSSFADMMIKAVAMIATCYYSVKAAYASSSGNAKQNLVKVAWVVIIINSLLIPKTTMLIEDHVTKQRDKVDNIPYGFAIPVGFMEKFGDILTASFEQVFVRIGSSNYRDYGMVFGARLVQDAKNWRIKTPEFVHNMDNFIRRCVVIDVAIGNKYTINDLFESEDIWRLIIERASKLRRVEMRVGNNNEILTCKEAIDTVLNPAFVLEINKIKDKYKKTEYGLAGNDNGLIPRGAVNPNNLFKRNLETIFGEYLGNGNSAEANLRQYMILNSMSDYSRTYGFARASMLQDTNWQIAGDLASIYLPILLSVIKGLVYASFIFMVPLMLLGGGGHKYISYIAVVASLQLWPSLNAVLNMFIDLYSAVQMKDIAEGGVSFTSYSKLGNYSDKIVAVASGLQMMIPFLAFNIVQGGVSGFIHLAGNITSASSSASSGAAAEVTTGNKNFDNYSSGNMQIAMQQGFKTDWNKSYKAGVSEFQREDGSFEKILPNGQTIDIRGPGLTESSGSNKIMLNDETSSQLHQSYSNNLTYRKSLEMQRGESQKSLDSLLLQYAQNINKHESGQSNYNFSALGSDEQAMKRALNHAKNLNSNYEYVNRQTKTWNVSAGGIIGVDSKIGVGIGSNVNIGARGEFTVDNSNMQSLNEQTSDASQSDWNKDKRILMQAAKNEDFNTGSSINKELLENINFTQDKIHEYDRHINRSFAREEQIQRQISHTSTISSGSNIDITPDVKKQLIENFGKDYQSADYLINNQASLTSADRKILAAAKSNVVAHYLSYSDNKLDNVQNTVNETEAQLPENVTKQMRSFENQSISEVDNYEIQGKGKVIERANNDGVNKEDVQETIGVTEHAIQYHHKELFEKVFEAIENEKQQNIEKLKNNQKIIDKKDSKRWFGEKKSRT